MCICSFERVLIKMERTTHSYVVVLLISEITIILGMGLTSENHLMQTALVVRYRKGFVFISSNTTLPCLRDVNTQNA
jgi:hypothetical protein